MRKIFTILTTYILGISGLHAQVAGTPDSSFSNEGFAIYNFNEPAFAPGFIEQPDGKLLLAGGKGNRYFIMRLNNDSTPDVNFGTNGIVEDSLFGYNPWVTTMKLETGGNIVISLSFNSGLSGFGYARYLSNGTIDSTFGANGYVLKPASANGHYRNAICPTLSNQYIIAQSIDSVGIFTTTYERLNSDGSYDMTFGTAGSLRLDDVLMEGTAWLPDGKFILFGFEQFSPGYSLIRFLDNGAIDSTYGTNGTVIEPFPPGGASLNGVYADSGGAVYTSMQFGFPASAWRISKFDSAGTKDAGFGNAGDKDFLNDRVIFSLAFGAGGKILACGMHTTAQGNENILQRWLPNGADDPGFANAGELIFVSTAQSSENAMVVLYSPTGKIYTLSAGSIQSTQDDYLLVSRFHSDPGTGLPNTEPTAAGISVYPNPAGHTVAIRLENAEYKKADWRIYNMDGETIFSIKSKTGGFTLPVSDLANGVYLIRVNSKDHTSIGKLIVHH